MDKNNTTTLISSDPTLVEQWIQYIVFYIGFGLLGFIGNIIMGIAIAHSKDLRSRFFIVVRTLILVRITIAYQFLVTGTYRALKTLQIVDTNQKRITCHFLHLFIPVSFTVELTLMLVLVIDRMLAIMTPLIYRQLTRRQARITCIGVVVVVGLFGKLIPSFIGWDFNEVVPCLNVYSAPSPQMNTYFQNSDFPIIILILVLYCILWICVKIRVRAMEHGNSESALQLQRQLDVLPLLRNIVLAHAAVTLTAKLLASLITYFPQQSLRLTAYSGNLNTVDLLVNVVVLLLSNADLKRATLNICRFAGHSGQIGSTGIGHSLQVTPYPISGSHSGLRKY